MTDKELIQRLQTLKQIKPNQDWVLLTKNLILPSPSVNKQSLSVFTFTGFVGRLFQRKFAYAFAVMLFLFVGLTGLVSFLPQDRPGKPSVAAENAIKSNVETFKIKSQNLASIAKTQPEAIPQALKEVKKEAKSLTQKIQKNPDLAKEVALDINQNRTYLSVIGSENIEETDDLEGTLVDILLTDAEEISWTDEQREKLANIKELRQAKKNSMALEEYLVLSAETPEGIGEPQHIETPSDIEETPEKGTESGTENNNKEIEGSVQNNSL